MSDPDLILTKRLSSDNMCDLKPIRVHWTVSSSRRWRQMIIHKTICLYKNIHFTWKAETKEDGGRERHIALPQCWFTPQTAVKARFGLSSSRELRAPLGSHTWVTGARVLGTSSTAFSGTSAMRLFRGGKAKTWTRTLMWEATVPAPGLPSEQGFYGEQGGQYVRRHCRSCKLFFL